MAINITVKFTIHLEHIIKASFFILPLVICSHLNISFQKTCINLHRPHTAHKLKSFVSSTFHQLPQNTARLPVTKCHIQLSQIFIFAYQCLIRSKYDYGSNSYIAAYNTSDDEHRAVKTGNFSSIQCIAKNKDL